MKGKANIQNLCHIKKINLKHFERTWGSWWRRCWTMSFSWSPAAFHGDLSIFQWKVPWVEARNSECAKEISFRTHFQSFTFWKTESSKQTIRNYLAIYNLFKKREIQSLFYSSLSSRRRSCDFITLYWYLHRNSALKLFLFCQRDTERTKLSNQTKIDVQFLTQT